MTNDQYIFTLILLGSLLLITMAFALGAFVFIHKQKLQRQQAFMQEAILKARIEVQEQSLKSLAMEIHDNIGQTLSMVRLMLTSVLDSDSTTDTKKFIEHASKLVNRSVDDLRNLAGTLTGKTIEQRGLIAAIEEELTYIHAVYRLKCSFIYADEPVYASLSSFENLLIFRILQEALQNIVKHSKGTLVKISMNIYDDLLEVVITDNGIGIQKRELQEGGLGVVSMYERARLLNATLNINSQPGNGTEIILKMKPAGNDKKNKSSHSR